MHGFIAVRPYVTQSSRIISSSSPPPCCQGLSPRSVFQSQYNNPEVSLMGVMLYSFIMACDRLNVYKLARRLQSASLLISGSLSPRNGASSGCGWRNGLQYGGLIRIYWISSCEQPTKGGAPVWGLGEVLTNTHRKKTVMLQNVYNCLGLGGGLLWMR